jgi:tetratricopeptide (TPR) repeat protein
MGILAQCYVHTGKLDLAVQLFDETIKLRKGRLGLNDPDTYSLMNNLAQAYITIGKPDLAVSLHEKVLKFRADRLGHEDPGTLRSLNNLAVACCLAKQGEKAVPLFAEWIGIRRKVAKMDDPIFARQLAQVSLVLLNANQYSASEIYLRECLTILKKSEPDLWFTFHTESMLGQCLLAQKDYTHAKELLFLGYKGMKAREKNIPLERRAYLNDALDRLILFHVETNQPEEAAKLHKLRISEVAPTPHSVK